jgi:hypothetical protein
MYAIAQAKLSDHSGHRKEEPLKNHLKRKKSFYFQGNSIPLLDAMATDSMASANLCRVL